MAVIADVFDRPLRVASTQVVARSDDWIVARFYACTAGRFRLPRIDGSDVVVSGENREGKYSVCDTATSEPITYHDSLRDALVYIRLRGMIHV